LSEICDEVSFSKEALNLVPESEFEKVASAQYQFSSQAILIFQFFQETLNQD
jgi:hypothetical protein